MGINRAVICGNLARDCEYRTTASGMGVAAFTVAVNGRKRGPDGEWTSYAEFLDCTIFGKRADGLAKHLVKGLKVAVAGKLRRDTWEDGSGQRRSRVYIVVDEIDLMSRRAANVTEEDEVRSIVEGAYPDAELYEEEIPF